MFETINNKIFDITNPADTLKLANTIAKLATPGIPILLYGTLGVGKTFFTTALIRTLTNNPNENVPSPTFSILQQYTCPIGPISHYDLYRIKDANELFELNIDEALSSHITIIEWPEIIADYITENFSYIALHFTLKDNIRTVKIAINKI